MKHENARHFDSSDLPEILQTARPKQIIRLLRDIAALDLAKDDVKGPQLNEE